jgi:AMP-binding enzyme C-terminal domain
MTTFSILPVKALSRSLYSSDYGCRFIDANTDSFIKREASWLSTLNTTTRYFLAVNEHSGWATLSDPTTVVSKVHSNRCFDIALSFPGVALAAAVEQPDPHTGETPILFVTSSPEKSIDRDALSDHMHAGVADGSARPCSIMVIDEMPVTPVGKIFKPPLREIRTGGARLARGGTSRHCHQARGNPKSMLAPKGRRFASTRSEP